MRANASRAHLSIGGRYAARANASRAHLSIGGRYAAGANASRAHLSIGGRYAARANASRAHLSIGGRYAASDDPSTRPSPTRRQALPRPEDRSDDNCPAMNGGLSGINAIDERLVMETCLVARGSRHNKQLENTQPAVINRVSVLSQRQTTWPLEYQRETLSAGCPAAFYKRRIQIVHLDQGHRG